MDQGVEDALAILSPKEGTLLRVLYLKLGNGTVLPFLGPYLDSGDLKSATSFALGDNILIEYTDPLLEDRYLGEDIDPRLTGRPPPEVH